MKVITIANPVEEIRVSSNGDSIPNRRSSKSEPIRYKRKEQREIKITSNIVSIFLFIPYKFINKEYQIIL